MCFSEQWKLRSPRSRCQWVLCWWEPASLLAVSSHCREQKGASSLQAPPPSPYPLPKATPSNTCTLGVRVSTCEFEGTHLVCNGGGVGTLGSEGTGILPCHFVPLGVACPLGGFSVLTWEPSWLLRVGTQWTESAAGFWPARLKSGQLRPSCSCCLPAGRLSVPRGLGWPCRRCHPLLRRDLGASEERCPNTTGFSLEPSLAPPREVWPASSCLPELSQPPCPVPAGVEVGPPAPSFPLSRDLQVPALRPGMW